MGSGRIPGRCPGLNQGACHKKMFELGKLNSVLKVLQANVRVLPAAGGAVEDLQRPDIEEIEDSLINKEIAEVTAFAEEPDPVGQPIYVSTPAVHRLKDHLFRFFIDGSLRTYYIATAIERDRTFPVELAQIGSACIYRLDSGRLTAHGCRNRVLLLIPKGGEGMSDDIFDELAKLNSPDESFQVIDTLEKTIHTSKGDIDLRTRAGGIARNRMHRLEIEIIKSTDGQRGDDAWVILDGAVKLDTFIQVDHLIGVAKSFDKKPQFHIPGEKTRNADVTGLIAGLPYAHRTRAFQAHGGKVAFWYVRLWEQVHLDYPLMGVLKIELPCPKGEPAPADLINRLSSALVAERSVTPYGQDKRWHCHLYPTFCAEETIKSRFYTQDVLLGAIRWPRPTISTS